jgi:hypothetical protein
MGYRPPKGVRPPQLEGKRIGRPKGVRNYESAWSDVIWAYRNLYGGRAPAPTPTAGLWLRFAEEFPDEFEAWVEESGRV